MIIRELKINYKSLLIWTFSLSVVLTLVFLIYPSIMANTDVDSVNKMIEMFPPEVIEMFNMDISSFSSAFGWFQSEGHVFLLLIGSIFSAILGGTILLKEENDKTIEYLYSKPISRNKIITAKVICGVINILLFITLIMIVNLIGLVIVDSIDYKSFFMLSLSPLIIFYPIFFIMLLISTFFKKTKKAMSIGIGFAFISYMLQVIGNMSDKIQFVKYFSVFELASAREIIITEAISLWGVIIAFIIIIIASALTYYHYNKKELV